MKIPKLAKIVDREHIGRLCSEAVELTGTGAAFWLYGMDGKCVLSSMPDSTPSPLSPEHIKSILGKTGGKIGHDCLSEPIHIGEEIIGTLLCHSPARDMDLLGKWKRFLSSIIQAEIRREMEKKDILADSLEKYREINVLYNMGERIFPNFLDLARLINSALVEAKRDLKVENGMVMLREEKSGEFMIGGSIGDKSQWQNCPNLDDGIIGRVSVTGKAQIVNELERDPLFTSDCNRNVICAPLKSNDKVIGVLAFADSCGERQFMSKDLKLIETIASQLSIAISNNYLYRENVEKEKIKNGLSRYVSRKLVESIMNGDYNIDLGGEKKHVSVLFSDIRGFSTFSENVEPSRLVEALNLYFSEMAEIIFHYDGTLDKFVGDMIMVIFGAPLKHSDDEARAIRTAIAMQRRVQEIQSEFMKILGKQFGIGIGINSGEVVAGNIGSNEHMDYTVIGDAVNVAERLEASAGRGQILVSKRIKDAAGDQFQFKYLGPNSVKGRQGSVEVYEVVIEDERGELQ